MALLLAGCGGIPRKAGMDDPEVQTLLKAAASFDRVSYGFSPIPSAADVRLETRPTSQYDAMLHITAKTSRTKRFEKRMASTSGSANKRVFRVLESTRQ